MSFRGRCVGLVFTLVWGSAVHADEFERFRAKNAVGAQKMVQQTDADLARAADLRRTDPVEAIRILESTMANLRVSTLLAEDQRRLLMSRVRPQLDQAYLALRQRQADQNIAQNNKPTTAPSAPPGTGPNPIGTGKAASDLIGKNITASKTQLDKVQAQRLESAFRSNELFRGIEASATPINGVVEYPKFWGDLTKLRKDNFDPKELELLKALNSTMAADFNNTRFRDFLDYMQEKAAITLFVHEPSLKDAMVDYDDPVTLKIPKATVRSILRKVLADRGLTYVIEEGSLQVMTIQRAREKTVARVYTVGDLVGLNIDPRIAQFDPFLAQQMRFQNGQYLANMVMTMVDPAYWQPNGGPGVIVFEPITNSLVVRASTEMHHMLGTSGMLKR